MQKKRILFPIFALAVWIGSPLLAQESAAVASGRANQQFVLFESERDKGSDANAMYGYLYESYLYYIKVLEAQDNGQYLAGAKNRLRTMYPALLDGAFFYSGQHQVAKALDFASAYIDMPRLQVFRSELLETDNRYP